MFCLVLQEASTKKPHLSRVFKVRMVFSRKGDVEGLPGWTGYAEAESSGTGYVGPAELPYPCRPRVFPALHWSGWITSKWPCNRPCLCLPWGPNNPRVICGHLLTCSSAKTFSTQPGQPIFLDL